LCFVGRKKNVSVPNNCPFKEEVLKEAEDHKRAVSAYNFIPIWNFRPNEYQNTRELVQ